MHDDKLWCNYSDLPSVLSYKKTKHKTNMTYIDFLEVITQLQKQGDIMNDLYKNKVDLIEFLDPYHRIIATLIQSIYGEEGLDWWSWFCYDNDFGTNGLSANDANGNPICYSCESLWTFLETLKTSNTN